MHRAAIYRQVRHDFHGAINACVTRKRCNLQFVHCRELKSHSLICSHTHRVMLYESTIHLIGKLEKTRFAPDFLRPSHRHVPRQHNPRAWRPMDPPHTRKYDKSCQKHNHQKHQKRALITTNEPKAHAQCHAHHAPALPTHAALPGGVGWDGMRWNGMG